VKIKYTLVVTLFNSYFQVPQNCKQLHDEGFTLCIRRHTVNFLKEDEIGGAFSTHGRN
jgi:hypothetical protein